MASLTVARSGLEWSRWNTAKDVVEVTLERVGLPADETSWSETVDGWRFSGSPHECEAVAAALEGMGLRIDRR